MRRSLWRWFRSVRRRPDETAALLARRRAAADHADALERLRRVEGQAKRLERMNDRNHFGEKLTQAFGGEV